MNRPIGVIVSAVLLVLISLFQLLMAFLMALGDFVHPRSNPALTHPGATPAVPSQAWMPLFVFAISAFCLALAVWGIMTVVGLFRMRRWARYSVLVIGGGMALVGLFSLLSMLVIMAVPLPAPPGADASHAHVAHTIARMLFGAAAVFYGLMLALGIFWLVYFNLKTVRAVFANATAGYAESRRPFMISLLAVSSMAGVIFCFGAAFLPIPLPFLGLILHGWEKLAYPLVYAALVAASGFGLWRLEEWGRRLTLALMAFGVGNSLVTWLPPSRMLRYTEEVNRSMNLPQQPQLPGHLQVMLQLGSLGVTTLYLIAIMALLHHYRGRFGRTAGPAGAEPVELA